MIQTDTVRYNQRPKGSVIRRIKGTHMKENSVKAPDLIRANVNKDLLLRALRAYGMVDTFKVYLDDGIRLDEMRVSFENVSRLVEELSERADFIGQANTDDVTLRDEALFIVDSSPVWVWKIKEKGPDLSDRIFLCYTQIPYEFIRV